MKRVLISAAIGFGGIGALLLALRYLSVNAIFFIVFGALLSVVAYSCPAWNR
jgi:hypothetical protein